MKPVSEERAEEMAARALPPKAIQATPAPISATASGLARTAWSTVEV